MIAMLIALSIAGAVAPDAGRQDAGWQDADWGKRHIASGLVCPVDTAPQGLPETAGRFELKSATGDAASFTCRYELRCRAAEGCTEAIGFASVTWNPKMDFAEQFKGLAASQGLAPSGEEGPAWASPPKLWATSGTGTAGTYAGWWQITAQGKPLNIGVLYNGPAEEAANALVGTAALANP
ncbi:hypothetical protein ACFQ1E_20400 [Sphingomonas canadensis]|uniref:Uncharacterized protein n=1 Tax=Sphingomonas canadensis TaxID=1219257 RepID=A0ABW3HB41_9SPHN|nr:hypothetical protein [Sphingomonas canadensis]MCW3838383.1 hypothetical protein [Sphingomonas canadensis]